MIKDIALDFIDFIRRGGEIGEGAELGATMQGSPRLKELMQEPSLTCRDQLHRNADPWSSSRRQRLLIAMIRFP